MRRLRRQQRNALRECQITLNSSYLSPFLDFVAALKSWNGNFSFRRRKRNSSFQRFCFGFKFVVVSTMSVALVRIWQLAFDFGSGSFSTWSFDISPNFSNRMLHNVMSYTNFRSKNWLALNSLSHLCTKEKKMLLIIYEAS